LTIDHISQPERLFAPTSAISVTNCSSTAVWKLETSVAINKECRVTSNDIPGVIARDVRFAPDDGQAVDRYTDCNGFFPRLRYGSAIIGGTIAGDVDQLPVGRKTTR
jgi:hypothetical protein